MAPGGMSGRRLATKALLTGLATGNVKKTDLGFSLLIASKPIVFLHAIVGAVLCGVWYFVDASDYGLTAFAIALEIMLGYLVYLGIGIVNTGLNRQRFSHLLRAPLVFAKLVGISLSALALNRNGEWNRTPRG